MPKKKNVLTDILAEELQQLKENNPQAMIVKLDCIHQNQGEGKCLDCNQAI